MARQPFLPAHKNAPFEIGSSLIEQLPKVAELVGRIAINWSGVDVQLSVALGSLLGVENAATVAVFTSLRNHRAQRDALRAAADQILEGNVRDTFEIILELHEELGKQRNSFVHAVWGRCESTPDGIIWSSVQAHANMMITDYHMSSTSQLTYDRRVENIAKDLCVVRLGDLEELNGSIMALEGAVRSFHSYLRCKSQPAGEHAYRELLSNPLVRGRIASRAKDSPPAP